MIEESKQEMAFRLIGEALTMCKVARPGDRSVTDRAYAVVITDMERIEAYFDYWINGNRAERQMP